MEDFEFDELTRKLAGSVSRRTVVKAAFVTVVGGLGAVIGLGKASAQGPNCKGLGASCVLPGQRDAECCTDYCAPTLPGPGAPAHGVCGCPAGQTACGERCVPTCPAGSGQVLNAATCTCQCTAGSSLCTNSAGVTSCVPACTGGQVQSNCACVCPSGQQFCNATAGQAAAGGGPRCVPACAGGQVLNQATCTCGCPTGTTICIPTAGGAAVCCPSGQTCSNGLCCPTGQVNVNGACCPSAAACTNPTTGAQTCCSQGNVCNASGVCVSSCML